MSGPSPTDAEALLDLLAPAEAPPLSPDDVIESADAGERIGFAEETEAVVTELAVADPAAAETRAEVERLVLVLWVRLGGNAPRSYPFSALGPVRSRLREALNRYLDAPNEESFEALRRQIRSTVIELQEQRLRRQDEAALRVKTITSALACEDEFIAELFGVGERTVAGWRKGNGSRGWRYHLLSLFAVICHQLSAERGLGPEQASRLIEIPFESLGGRSVIDSLKPDHYGDLLALSNQRFVNELGSLPLPQPTGAPEDGS